MSERIKQSELAAVVVKEQEKGGSSEIHGEGQPVKFTGPFTFTTKSNVALEFCLGGTTILHYMIRLMVFNLQRRVRLHAH
jgi:hypothetical protein